jgi:hypothetical protein
LPSSYHHELASRQFVSVLQQRLIQVFDLDLQLGSWKSEEYDAGVSEALEPV